MWFGWQGLPFSTWFGRKGLPFSTRRGRQGLLFFVRGSVGDSVDKGYLFLHGAVGKG